MKLSTFCLHVVEGFSFLVSGIFPSPTEEEEERSPRRRRCVGRVGDLRVTLFNGETLDLGAPAEERLADIRSTIASDLEAAMAKQISKS